MLQSSTFFTSKFLEAASQRKSWMRPWDDGWNLQLFSKRIQQVDKDKEYLKLNKISNQDVEVAWELLSCLCIPQSDDIVSCF